MGEQPSSGRSKLRRSVRGQVIDIPHQSRRWFDCQQDPGSGAVLRRLVGAHQPPKVGAQFACLGRVGGARRRQKERSPPHRAWVEVDSSGRKRVLTLSKDVVHRRQLNAGSGKKNRLSEEIGPPDD
jgi:hypothetical protein